MFVRVAANPTEVPVPLGATKVAVLSLSTKEQKEYSTAEQSAIIGIEDIELDRCENKDEFRRSFNANHFLFIDGSSRWSLHDLHQVTGERPLGLYQAADQLYVLEKDATNFVMRPMLHVDAWVERPDRLMVRANNVRGLLDLQGTRQSQA